MNCSDKDFVDFIDVSTLNPFDLITNIYFRNASSGSQR